MQVKSVMSDRVLWVPPDAPVRDIAIKMRDAEVGSIPVVEDDKLIGMVTDRDIVVRGLCDAREPQQLTAADLMSPGMLYCFEDQSVEEVLQNMADEQIRRLPVVSRDKRLVGIVSLGDLSKGAPSAMSGRALENISADEEQWQAPRGQLSEAPIRQ
ncbi:MAG TPA: CBS domain-containing protein [Steroidobacteraceae bacterium]|nr:CBS domain-containing protein [Steroidobacteraceae bacterium]